MLCGDDGCELWDVGFVEYGLVVDCGSGGVEYFCVVSGFVVEYFA